LDGGNVVKIGYSHDSAMPGPEANTVNVAKMCDAFACNGDDVLLVHLDGAGKQRGIHGHYGLKHRFRTVALPLPRPLPARKKLFSLASAAVMRSWSPDLVYGRKAIQLLPIARLGLPVVLELHSLFSEGEVAMRGAFAELLAGIRLRRIVTISKALADDVAAEWPQSASRLLVAHDAADPQRHPVEPVPRPHAGSPCVGYAGHLYPGKGMELIAQLAAQRPGVDFVVLGGQPDDIARWKATTASLANLHFRGMQPHAEVPAHLADCDLVLAPYAEQVQVSDGRTDVARWMSPLKIFEYMAQGHAIMASSLPVIREILSDGRTAALLPPGDVPAWTERLDALLADAEARRRMGEAARNELEARYTWKQRAASVLAGL
jgi:glycosyltransferase involved in cell wall biosynthesis